MVKIFGRETFIEWGGIPCLVWIGVVCLLLNHIIYPVIGAFLPFIQPVDLPKEYWDALAWIICGLFGKKVGDKYVTHRHMGTSHDDNEGGESDGDGNQPDDQH